MIKNDYMLGILIGLFVGICFGFVMTMFIVSINVGNIQEVNGLMYQKDCLLLNSSINYSSIRVSESNYSGYASSQLTSTIFEKVLCSSDCFLTISESVIN
jgi:hypothetical protein